LTSIVTEQLPLAAIPPPARVSVSKPAFTVAVPPQVFPLTAAAKVRPAGSVSAKPTPVSAISELFVTVIVSALVVPTAIGSAAKTFPIVGSGTTTVSVSLPVVVPVSSVESTTDVVFVCVPPTRPSTAILIVQLESAAIDPPVTESASAPPLIVVVPLHVSVIGAPEYSKPAGKVSEKLTPVRPNGALFVASIVSTLVAPALIGSSIKVLLIVGRSPTSRSSDPVSVPVNSVELTTLVVFV